MKDHHQMIEPTADQRAVAKNIVGMYVSLVQEGMPPDEARDLLARWFANMNGDE